MRRGELLALRWSDLNFETGILQARRNVAKCKGWVMWSANQKTKAGPRKIGLTGAVLEALKEHRERQPEARTQAGAKWQEKGLIFPNIYGSFLNPDTVWSLFKKLLKEAGLPDVRFHDPRHSVATILLAAKIDLKVVSELLGYSSVAITADIYAHVLAEQQQEVIDKMSDLFKRS